MDCIINKAAPVKVGQLNDFKELQDIDITTTVKSLVTKKAIVLIPTGEINFVYPVSALPTHHNVHLSDGRKFNAMCAVDAMGAALTFKQDIKVKSKCSECGESTVIDIRDEKIVEVYPEDTHVMHVDLKRIDNWSGSC